MLALPPPHGRNAWHSSTRSSPANRSCCKPTPLPSKRVGASARPPKTSRSPTKSSQPLFAPAPTATSPETWPWPTGCSRLPAIRVAAVPWLLPDHASLRHPARTEQAQEVRCSHLPGRRRDCRHRRCPGRVLRGHLGVTATSGPGLALKSETIGLAVSLELPLLICDIQRGGPSTGLPTKTEQSDLLQAMFGRNGEAPVPIVAPRSPSDCFTGGGRSSSDRHQVPNAGHLAVRRLPRQRLRALDVA